jgi:hypothetical protein
MTEHVKMLLGQYTRGLKKYMEMHWTQLFYMGRMQEEITGRIQILTL